MEMEAPGDGLLTIANQIHGFTIDYGKFILMKVIIQLFFLRNPGFPQILNLLRS